MSRWCRILTVLCLLATVSSTLAVYPHELAYFNEAAGGPENGYRHLLGSNLDWGQDLVLLKRWLLRHGYDPARVNVEGYYGHPAENVLGFADPSNSNITVTHHAVSADALLAPKRVWTRSALFPFAQRVGYCTWLIEAPETMKPFSSKRRD